MNKYLVIAVMGDNAMYKEWIKDSPEFDIVLLYYGSNPEKALEYTKDTPYVYAAKGEKFHLLKSFILSNPDFIPQYSYIWLPDDDVLMSTRDINKMFNLVSEYELFLAQPSMTGYISHQITSPQPGNLLRYTNFVEVNSPVMSLKTLMLVKDTFDRNYSGWGYDALWPYMLNYPQDKIAIIDSIVMTHTKPVGTDYSRFFTHPKFEAEEILNTLPRTENLYHKEYNKIPL
jgi:hypothetical protein